MTRILAALVVLGTFLYYTVPYTGKTVEETASYIKDTMTLVKRIVERYEREGYSLKGTSISMHR